MEYVYIGKLVNTHALKGEVKIISNFEYKDKAFVKGKHFYIDKEKVTINSYRRHKIFDMVTFKEYDYINDVLKFKGKKVYMDKEELDLKKDELLFSDYIGLDGYYNDKYIGKISNIIVNNGYKLFYINGKYIPFNKEFISSIDIKNNKIIFKGVDGLL